MNALKILAAASLLAAATTAQYEASNRTARRIGLQVHEFEGSSTVLQPANTFRIDGPPGHPFALYADAANLDTKFGYQIGGSPSPLMISALDFNSSTLQQIDPQMTPFVSGIIPTSGYLELGFPVPVNLPVGLTLTFQAIASDPLSTTGLAPSNAVQRTVSPPLTRPDPNTYDAAGVPVTQQGNTNDIEQADLDGDGDMDLVAVDCAGDIHVFERQDGILRRVMQWNVINASAAELVDLNNDSMLDLVVSSEGPMPGIVYVNNGLAGGPGVMGAWQGFGPAMPLTFTFAHLGLPRCTDVESADFNGDGWIDLVFACTDCINGQLNHVFFNGTQSASGPGLAPLLTDHTSLSMLAFGAFTRDDSQDVECADLDNDGDYDLVFANLGGPQPNRGVDYYWLNRGGGNFDGPFAIRDYIGPTLDICLGDVDGDGYADIYLGNWLDANATCSQYNSPVQDHLILSGGRPFSSVWSGVDASALLELGTAGSTTDVEMTDYDLDGDLDIFVAEGGKCFAHPNTTRGIRVLTNNGGGWGLLHNSFSALPTNLIPSNVSSFDIADIEFGDWQKLNWNRDLGIGHTGSIDVLHK